MEELLELRDYIERQQYPEALSLIEEMEEMSREDKINKIGSFAEILLLHLIKQAAEKRTTRSWQVSIQNAIWQIIKVNRRRKSKGTYVNETELQEIIKESYQPALRRASLEAFGGIYTDKELGQMIDRAAIEREAVALIQQGV